MRAHILSGLLIALGSLDEVIALIKKSNTTEEARLGLMSRFGLDVDQANAILEMQLRKLTGLEQDKIKAEYDELIKKIAEYESILADRQKVLNIIKTELIEDREKFAGVKIFPLPSLIVSFSTKPANADGVSLTTFTV